MTGRFQQASSYEERFARFAVGAGAVSATLIFVGLALLQVEQEALLGVGIGAVGSAIAYVILLRRKLWFGMAVFLASCAIGVWLAAFQVRSGEGAASAGLSWLLLGVFGSLVLRPRELLAFGAICTVGALSLFARLLWSGRVEPTTYSTGVVVVVFVPTGFLALAEIAGHFRDAVARWRAAEQAARAALEERSRFLANMSHELRTPLNAILGYSELLIDEVDEPSAQADLRRIHRSGRLLLGHIDALLDLSKLEAGKMHIWIERVDVSALVREVVDQVTPAAMDRGNTIQLEVSEGLELVSDRLRVMQILSNLVSNANKFTEGGTLRIRAGAHETGVEFEVEDTGVGMTPETLERIFEPFVQGDPSTTRRFGGTGLGLALVRDFVDLLGGSITVHSQEGRGTCFRVHLPHLFERMEAQHRRRTDVGAAPALIVD